MLRADMLYMFKLVGRQIWTLMAQVPTETLLKFVDGGKARLKQMAIEDLLQMTLPTVRRRTILQLSRACTKARREMLGVHLSVPLQLVCPSAKCLLACASGDEQV